jgi:hypothetical protein
MLKSLKIFGLIIMALSLNSCIELVEEIKINTDNSGNYHFYLKHNGLGMVLNLFSLELNLEKYEQKLRAIEKTEGVSNFKMDINPRKAKFSIQFDFENDKTLNRAFYSAAHVKKRFYYKNIQKISNSKIKRPNLTPYLIYYIDKHNILDEIPNQGWLKYISYRYRIISYGEIVKTFPQNTEINNKEFVYTQLYKVEEILFEKKSTKSIIHLK